MFYDYDIATSETLFVAYVYTRLGNFFNTFSGNCKENIAMMKIFFILYNIFICK